MKLFYAFAAAALLSSSVAFAQTTATAPDNASPASPTTAQTPANGTPSLATCRKQAKDKNLTGADKKQYVRDCRAGKAPS
jgi:hypothetical protein